MCAPPLYLSLLVCRRKNFLRSSYYGWKNRKTINGRRLVSLGWSIFGGNAVSTRTGGPGGHPSTWSGGANRLLWYIGFWFPDSPGRDTGSARDAHNHD